MPVKRITRAGKVFYRWGTSGKLYKKRSDAERQGRAIRASGYTKKKRG